MKVSTIRSRPPHDAIVVAGVHRKCAVGIKDTHIKQRMPHVKLILRIVHSCFPPDVNCSMMELPTVSGLVRTHSRKLRDVSGGLHTHADNCRQSQALSTSGHEKCWTSQAGCMPMLEIADSPRVFALVGHAAHENCGTFKAVCTPMMKMADSLRL